MMIVPVIGYEDIEHCGNREDMEEKFVGLGLNRGSKQWGILSCFSKCARKTNCDTRSRRVNLSWRNG